MCPVKTRKPEPETRDGFTMSQERLNELTAEDNAKIEAAASKPNFEEV